MDGLCVRRRFDRRGLISSIAVARDNIRGYQCWDGQFAMIIVALVFSLNTFDNTFPTRLNGGNL